MDNILKKTIYDGRADVLMVFPDDKPVDIGSIRIHLTDENIDLDIDVLDKDPISGRHGIYHIVITEREPVEVGFAAP